MPHPTLSAILRDRLTDEQREEIRLWNDRHRWSPNQFRYAAATQVRKAAGLVTARAVLGHSTAGVTEQYYTEVDIEEAASVIKRIGLLGPHPPEGVFEAADDARGLVTRGDRPRSVQPGGDNIMSATSDPVHRPLNSSRWRTHSLLIRPNAHGTLSPECPGWTLDPALEQ